MRVLITGGYGFIGSHVAELFYKEGYEVHILDNLSSGKKENISFKHKSYILSTDDPKCGDIISSYQFETIVYLASQTGPLESTYNPTLDAQSNIIGLINILQYAKKYKAKKFIFASSTAIYSRDAQLPINEYSEVDPVTPNGINKLAAETYCSNFLEDSEMEIVCFRMSNVYGPRQRFGSDGGVISQFSRNIVDNLPIEIHGDGTQTRDFLYVGDAAFAIFRAAKSMMSGTYNLSSNSQHTILDVVNILEHLHGTSATKTYTSTREDDLNYAQYDNTKIKRDFDWTPYYTLAEGLEKTYAWLMDQKTKTDIPEKKKEQQLLPTWLQSWKPYIENILLFSVLSFIMINFTLPVLTTFFFGVLYILIVGLIFGNPQISVGVVLATLLLITDNILKGREIIALLYDTTFLFEFSIFILFGLIMGYSDQRKKTVISKQQEKIEEMEKRYNFLEEIHTEVREVKDELQYRLKNNEDSFGKIHSIIKDLDNLEPEKIFTKTVQVVEKIMRCQGVSIYVLNQFDSYLQLIASSDRDATSKFGDTIEIEEHPFIQQMMCSGKPYFNRYLASNAPLMAAPIYYNDELRAIITIDHVSFENFSTYHENLFIVISELIQTALCRALQFIKISEQTRYIEHTNIMQFEVFQTIVQIKEEAFRTYNVPYKIVTLPIVEQQLELIGTKTSNLLREADYISYHNGILYILLSNTSDEDLPFVLNHFENAGFNLQVEQKAAILKQ